MLPMMLIGAVPRRLIPDIHCPGPLFLTLAQVTNLLHRWQPSYLA
jgi:hypothetical protein